MDVTLTGTDAVSVRTHGGYWIARGGGAHPAVVQTDDVDSDHIDRTPVR